jgi:uncharacterized protein (TIGR04255 family)
VSPRRPSVELADQPEVRCWFFHSDTERLIQVQRDRFIHNWRKIGNASYPSYDKIKPRFETNWKTFCGFLVEEEIEVPSVLQCEVTYINHFEIGREWNSMADLIDVLPAWSGRLSDGFLPIPEIVQVGANFVIPGNQGRLRVNLQPAVRLADRKQILQLTLTARGAPNGTDTSAILEWFDLGHEWVVRGFADFTSHKMHQIWRRRR